MKRHSFMGAVIEYLFAAPILGLPCTCFTPVITGRWGVFTGLACICLIYLLLAIFQLRRISLVDEIHRRWSVLSGGIGFVVTVVSLLFFLKAAAMPVITDGQFPSDATVKGLLLFFGAFAIGYSSGFTVLVFGYARKVKHSV
jgi:hypothetical protein